MEKKARKKFVPGRPFIAESPALPDRLSLPTGALGLTPFLSLRGREELEVFGCLSILCYEEETILLQLTKGRLRVRGKRLSMRTYHQSCITVAGEIRQLDFPEEDGPGEGGV